jgi:hypothetical protein
MMVLDVCCGRDSDSLWGQMVHSDEQDLMNWCMVVNDKLERKMENPSFDAAGAIHEMSMAYFKEKKVMMQSVCGSRNLPVLILVVGLFRFN